MQNPMSKKEIFRWSHAQEILLKELVGKKIILVDKATSNNSKMREAAWEDVRSQMNLNFGLNLTRAQVRKKWNDAKYIGKAKVTTAVENGSKDDGREVAKTWGEFKKLLYIILKLLKLI